MNFVGWSMRKLKFAVVPLVVVFGIGIYYYKFISDYSYLATIEDNNTSSQSSGSEGGFHAEKGGKVTVTLSSTVKAGNLQIELTDANKEIVRSFDTNKNYTDQVIIENTGDYKLLAKYSDFIGSFNVKCK